MTSLGERFTLVDENEKPLVYYNQGQRPKTEKKCLRCRKNKCYGTSIKKFCDDCLKEKEKSSYRKRYDKKVKVTHYCVVCGEKTTGKAWRYCENH